MENLIRSMLFSSQEKRFDMHDESSPTHEVARLDEDNHFTKAPHLHQMMSLDNTYDAEDLREFSSYPPYPR